jgi:small subunit ribosomal protein S2
MNDNLITKEDLIKAGSHYGHPASKWNPNYKDFIVAKKNGIHIIDVDSTINYLNSAVKEMLTIVKGGGNILFVGTKAQARDSVVESADKSGMFYIVERWLGGTLTNFSTIKKSVKRLNLLEKDSSPIYNNLTKKEKSQLYREKIKLADLHRGIKDMRHLPSALFVVDAKHERIAIAEANCLGIPTFGLVDTNTNPHTLDYPIPANDDSIKTIKLILSYIAEEIYTTLNRPKNDDLENTESVNNPDGVEQNSTIDSNVSAENK